jgi:hypothetical protein
MVLRVAHQHVRDQVGVVELELAEAVGSQEANGIAIALRIFFVEAGGVDSKERSIPDPAAQTGPVWPSSAL